MLNTKNSIISCPTWIWYYGDFEIHQHMLLGLQREERGYNVPAFWQLHDCNRLVRFTKDVYLNKEETINVSIDGVGYVSIDGKRLDYKQSIQLTKGNHNITVIAGNAVALPSIFVQADTITSDESWKVSCLDGKEINVGRWNLNDVNTPPSKFCLPCTEIFPVSSEIINNGELFDFGKETYIKLKIKDAKMGCHMNLYYGESRGEALSKEHAVIRDNIIIECGDQILPARACRYVYIENDLDFGKISGLYEYLPMDLKGSFKSSCELINKIYDVAEYTLRLNSRMFFLDGIKRDRWVWSGDAYQSYFLNYYSYFNEEINKRTMLALRGKDPITVHINTIADYSLYWIISIEDYLKFTGDTYFVKQIYDKMVTLIEFCISRCNDEGLIEGLDGDWIFIDWADMGKHGALCAMQMLFCKALETMAKCSEIVGNALNKDRYFLMFRNIRGKILKTYWNEEKGAFATTYHNRVSSDEVRRHANIFAIIFDFADDAMLKKIKTNVLMNDEIPQITTPYFKFYELEALCKINEFDKAMEIIESYWGGMIKEGATTFWEEYNPNMKGQEHYAMYGEPYDKSLCHAWGASPIYLIGRYCLGVYPTKQGYEEFEVKPNLGKFEFIEGTVPVKNGVVHVKMDKNKVEIKTNVEGGYLVINNQRIKINNYLVFELNKG